MAKKQLINDSTSWSKVRTDHSGRAKDHAQAVCVGVIEKARYFSALKTPNIFIQFYNEPDDLSGLLYHHWRPCMWVQLKRCIGKSLEVCLKFSLTYFYGRTSPKYRYNFPNLYKMSLKHLRIFWIYSKTFR